MGFQIEMQPEGTCDRWARVGGDGGLNWFSCEDDAQRAIDALFALGGAWAAAVYRVATAPMPDADLGRAVLDVEPGDYLGTFAQDAHEPRGQRCGYSETQLEQIRASLGARGLGLDRDALGLIVTGGTSR